MPPPRSPELPPSGIPWPPRQKPKNNCVKIIFPNFSPQKRATYYFLFQLTRYLLGKRNDMKQTINYRVKRQMPEEQRRKISEALKGKKKDPQTKKAISRGLSRYWQKVEWIEDAREGE